MVPQERNMVNQSRVRDYLTRANSYEATSRVNQTRSGRFGALRHNSYGVVEHLQKTAFDAKAARASALTKP